ncbi:MAG: DOMON-like domain-containing protein [Pseudolabrys sp.]
MFIAVDLWHSQRPIDDGMRQLLKHPDSCSSGAGNIEVEVTRPGVHSLLLSYIVTGKMSDVRMPPVTAAARCDGLWRHTCFEAFVRASSGEAYYEFNFAPSTQWAAYRFSSYRSGMCVAAEISAPSIEVRSSPDRYTLQASLDLDSLSLPHEALWHLGLSAVIEDINGSKSYWALMHPAGKPDFHYADSFVHELSQAEQP